MATSQQACADAQNWRIAALAWKLQPFANWPEKPMRRPRLQATAAPEAPARPRFEF